ncbi:MAG: metallophosphoesterase [Anaerolineae bacterium]|nr:metallophosphoesterase [Anaerolineae bacterium]
MRFIHISDSHLGKTPDFIYNGFNSYCHLEKVIETINGLPFSVDFVLHSGDVTEYGSFEEYALARRLLERLRFPVKYVVGNHDNAALLQNALLGIESPSGRYDHSFTVDGVQVVLLDTNNGFVPNGTLTERQLADLRALCTPEGMPLIIAMHHPPLPLDTPWMAEGWASFGFRSMLLNEGEAFRAAIAPARERLRGVLFGHIHRAFQVQHDGVFYCSAPSTVIQFAAHPEQRNPKPAPEEPPAFALVTLTDSQLVVRQYALTRPEQG